MPPARACKAVLEVGFGLGLEADCGNRNWARRFNLLLAL